MIKYICKVKEVTRRVAQLDRALLAAREVTSSNLVLSRMTFLSYIIKQASDYPEIETKSPVITDLPSK